ncbi:MAG: siphovirus ReqiPepy6 Gp37-like family protein, partial [Actinobacteria bacterium]|nr:siphovirus ReqiPepy6 Gp37-like family protein [Actinomycetota bacterium]
MSRTITLGLIDGSTGVLKAGLSGAYNRSWQSHRNDTGSGSFEIDVADPGYGQIALDDIIYCYLDGTLRFSWLVQRIEPTKVAPEEEEGQTARVSGKGRAARLGWAVVYPEGGIGRRDPDSRSFGWHSPYLGTAATWGQGYTIQTGQSTDGPWPLAPDGWPDPAAEWIWGAPLAGNPPAVPPGHCYFKGAVNLPSTGRYAVFASGDDGFELYIDGNRVAGDYTQLGWGQSRRVDVDLDAGYHLFAIHGVNDGGPAGVIMTVLATTNAGTRLGGVVYRTQAWSWECSAYPPRAPGLDPGTIVGQCLYEFHQRGGRNFMVSFGAGAGRDGRDSNGTLWPADFALDISIPVGTTVLDVLHQLAEMGVDWTYGVDTDTLGLYLSRGVDRPAVFRPAVNIASLRHSLTSEELVNAALGRTKSRFLLPEGWIEVDNAGSIAAHERREVFLSAGAQEPDYARQLIGEILTDHADAIEGATIGAEERPDLVAPADRAEAYVDYDVGDWVHAPDRLGANTRYRVQAITVTEDADGNVTCVPEVGTVLDDTDQRLQRALKRMVPGSLLGGAEGVGMPEPVPAFEPEQVVPTPLSDATDVSADVPNADDVLTWDPSSGANGEWVPMAGGFDAPSFSVVAENLFSGAAPYAGASSTRSNEDHTHGTPWPRHPQSGVPYVDFGSLPGILALGRRAGEWSAALLGTEDLTSYERTYLTSPVGASGYGRPTLDWRGNSDGTGKIMGYNDYKVDGSYGPGTGSPSRPISFELTAADFTMLSLPSAPAVSPAGAGRIYYDATLQRYRVSQAGGPYVDLVGSGGAAFSTTVVAEDTFSGAAPSAGNPLTPTYSLGGHTHGTALPRHPRSGVPYVDFGVATASFGILTLGRLINEAFPAFIGTEDSGPVAPNYERLYLVPPVRATGYGRPSIDLRGPDSGDALVKVYDDHKADGTYSNTSGSPSRPLEVELTNAVLTMLSRSSVPAVAPG